ncbi:MAG: 2-oxo acid dehydrogenase subunit E2 [Chloroflexi bacterium]|nr:2-oxo acid dehydrogenase subunit E2 [Chloroflexota bacterium]
MATNVLLPQWGMNMEDGTLVKWLVNEGDEVQQGQPLVEIETAKINSELESPTAGVVAHIMSDEGTVVKVGDIVVVIGAPDENPPRPESASTRPVRTARRRATAPRDNGSGRSTAQVTPIARRLARDNDIDLNIVAGSGPRGRITEDDIRAAMTVRDSQPAAENRQVIPRARQLARQNNVDLSEVTGTGPGGRVLVADVERAMSSSDPASAYGDAVAESTSLTGLRKVISDRMSLSVRTMAQLTLTTEIDVTELVNLRETLVSLWRPHKLRPMDQDLIVAATGDALKKHPRLNSYLQDDTVMILRDVNVGVAMAVPDGLVVPVVNSVDESSLLDIARRLRELASRTRNNSLTMDDVSGAGFTLTSLSNYDIDVFTPIIDPPQVAILGIGRISQKPVVLDGEITIRSTMHASVTFDHRALDGVPVAEFIRTLKSNLESTEWLTARVEGA